MKQHIKRLSAPIRWNILRKEETYIQRPHPAGTPLAFTLPLSQVIRMTQVASTMKEIKYILSGKKVLVDGKIRQDPKFGVGFLAAIAIPEENLYRRLSLNLKGHLTLISITAQEAGLKVANVTDIRRRKDGYDYTLFDGRTIRSPKRIAATGSSILFSLPDQGVKDVFPLEEGASVMLIAGKRPGTLGKVERVAGDVVTVKTQGKSFTVSKEFVLVTGKASDAITLA